MTSKKGKALYRIFKFDWPWSSPVVPVAILFFWSHHRSLVSRAGLIPIIYILLLYFVLLSLDIIKVYHLPLGFDLNPPDFSLPFVIIVRLALRPPRLRFGSNHPFL